MLTVNDLKNDLRIDHDLDDGFLGRLLASSEEYLLGAIELKNNPDLPLFDTAQFLLVCQWYENRMISDGGYQQEIPFTITSIIQSLRGLGGNG